MNKSEFLSVLGNHLKSLEKEEYNKFITFYDEMIEDYKENGYTEEEAIKKIGSPQSIASDIIDGQETVILNIPSTGSKMLNIILLILGFPLWGSLLLALVLCILSAYIIILCIPFTTGVSAISFFVISLVSILGSPFMMADTLAVGLIQLGVGIASLGISFLLILLTIFISKKVALVTKSFTLKLTGVFHKKVVKA
jgi:uncharacterized membrane protein